MRGLVIGTDTFFDFLQPVVQGLPVDEQLVRSLLFGKVVVKVDPQRMDELRAVFRVMFDQRSEVIVDKRVQNGFVGHVKQQAKQAKVGEKRTGLFGLEGKGLFRLRDMLARIDKALSRPAYSKKHLCLVAHHLTANPLHFTHGLLQQTARFA
jgi:hypothetical protein